LKYVERDNFRPIAAVRVPPLAYPVLKREYEVEKLYRSF